MKREDLVKPALASWREVDEKLGEYFTLKNELQRVSTKKNAQIQRIKAELQEETADLEAEIRSIEQLLDIFVRFNLEEIRTEERKSICLTNGTIKTKTDLVYVYPDDDMLVELLKKHGQDDCVKTEEKPKKAVLRAKLDGDKGLQKKLCIDEDEQITISYKPA